ncbi:hypothetical protein BV25DRAFT_1914101 [Artomyces pyxidatus]|uniref:Uncharacterized protein n=1 Tax=Artomyces pyxidatus TaxID=48021 RepID=A0ACB8T838_9AGAM|nr:hypothetical protein BV25DRAFT_1914101 [Artomyces pyxidatus]
MPPRRSNRSHKVPGVKLRPADPKQPKALHSSHRRRTPTPSPPSSPAREDHDISFFDTCPRPFKGITLCATGVDKSTIFGKAGEMGASTSTDFTDLVTHLIAQDHGGPKYLCAVERKIPIIQPSWILENFDVWQQGDEFDLDETMKEHRLPVFSGVTLSISGIEDIPHRTDIHRKLVEHGGKYEKNIERPVRVTHLLCSGDQETDKMKYARKFNAKGEADIQLVWEEWFWDSLEFGGRFDETQYLVTLPRPERKQVPEVNPNGPITITDSHGGSVEPNVPMSSNAVTQPAAGHDDDEDEIAAARRVPAATLQVWESLLRPRGFVKVGSELVRTVPDGNSQADPDRVRGSQPLPRSDKGKGRAVDGLAKEDLHERKSRSALSTFMRSNSFAPNHIDPAAPASSKQPFRKTQSLLLGAEPLPVKPPEDSGGGGINSASRVFSGLRFRARGEASSASVRDAVQKCGGVWVEDQDDEEVDFILVRLVSGSALLSSEHDETARAKYRTECWLEGCLAHDRICAADEHVSFTPLAVNGPIVGASQIVLSPSGLDMAEDMWTKRLARALGVTHAPTFSRASTHLLCPSARGMKFAKAQEWGIPVVNVRWLAEMASAGTIPAVHEYLVKGPDGARDSDEISREKGQLPNPGELEIEALDVIPAPTPARAKSLSRTNSLVRVPSIAALPEADPDESFGRPVNGLLGETSEPLQEHHSVPALSRSSTIRRSPSFPLSIHASAIISNRPIQPPQAGSETEDEGDEHARVPSSATPSPMKMPPVGPSKSTPVSSPVRPVVSEAGARALQESITNLLGKRTSMDDTEDVGRVRGGKRARPRSKPQSRQDSGAGESVVTVPEVYDASYAYSEDIHLLRGTNNADESGMVMYEDPAQRAERRRLMSLLGGPEQSKEPDEEADAGGKAKKKKGAGKGAGATRRSSRVAGF